MSEFKKVITEIKRTLKKILLFDVFTESLLVFLCVYIFLMIFNLYPILSVIPALIYFLFMLYKRRKLTSIKSVENKFPILHEALRTANDSIDEDNYVVNELRNQVKERVRRVTASSFMDMGGDIIKIVVSIGLIFLILGISICEANYCNSFFRKIDVQKAVKKVDFNDIYEKMNVDNFKLSTDIAEKDVEAKAAMFGDESVARLGRNDFKIKIKLANDQIDIRDVSETETEKEFTEIFAQDVYAVGDSSFEENIAMEHKDIVKNYFHSIKGG